MVRARLSDVAWVAIGLSFVIAGSAQTKQAPKSHAFEVVSIRPSDPKGIYVPIQILPDGYRVKGIGLWVTIAEAYFPSDIYSHSQNRVKGEPSWVTGDKYDIEAKVSPADLPDWQNPTKQQTMLHEMLQSMLAERLKLVVHRAPAEIPGYALVVAKGGPKLKATPPGEVFPPVSPLSQLPDGGEVIAYRADEKSQATFYGASMAGLAHHMCGLSFNHPVVDKTGLPGRYDFVLAWRSMDGSDQAIVTPDSSDPLANWNVQALGLRLVPVNIPTETIVIDHIERPSAN